MNFKFIGLTPKQETGVNELCEMLDISISDDGLAVSVSEGESITLEKKQNGIVLTYSRSNELYRALSMLKGFATGQRESLKEHNHTEMLCYMADMSRNGVYNMSSAKLMIRTLALCGYDSLMLYTEDTYEIPEYSYFGYMRGRFTKEELKEIDAYADIFGIEVIPCIQTLAHLVAVTQWSQFSDIHDNNDILMVGEDGTYELIRAMLKTCKECFRTDRINLGMDEAHTLGQGKYLDKNGYRQKPEIMLEHLRRVASMCEKIGYRPMIWSDMFFRMQFGHYRVSEGEIPEKIRRLVPQNVTLIYWDYVTQDKAMFEHMVHCHEQFPVPIGFAGGISRWYGFAPLNRFSMESARLQMDVCNAHGIKQIIVTAWGDEGSESSQFSILPTMLYYAERAYCEAEPELRYLEERARQCMGMSFSELLMTDIPNNVGEKYFDENTLINPCKYLLYNDLLLGLMDNHMDADTVSNCYRANAEKLKPLTAHSRWGYLFETMYRLCDLLIEKSDCSLRIRKAYEENDLQTLKSIAQDEIPLMIEKLDAFIVAFREQWFRENKPFGFEIQESRLGGLRLRWQSVASRLMLYVDSNIDRIEELEQEKLPFEHIHVYFAEGDNPYCRYHDSSFMYSSAKVHS